MAVERFEPEFFGPSVALIEVGPMAAKAFGEATGHPAGRLVAGACELLDIGERLGQQRGIAVGGLPRVRQSLHGHGQAMRQRNRGNHPIATADELARPFQQITDAGVVRHASRVEGQRLKRPEEGIQHRLAAARPAIFGGTVIKLRIHHRADRHVTG